MNNRVSSIANIKTIKALRGESLKIDLGKTFTGTLTAWMKKDPNAPTYRSFEVEGGRYLILTQDKARDYYDIDSVLVEAIAGRWYFDVERLEDGAPIEETETIYTGTIFFANDVTGSEGYEVTDPGSYIPTYTLSTLADDIFALLKNGVAVSTIDLSEYLKIADLPPLPKNTSDLVNDGADGTSIYVEQDELGAAATSNDYNDLDNLPVVPAPITNTSELTNNGSDGTSTYVEADEIPSLTANKLDKDISTLTAVSLPLLDTDKVIVNRGGIDYSVDKSELGGGGAEGSFVFSQRNVRLSSTLTGGNWYGFTANTNFQQASFPTNYGASILGIAEFTLRTMNGFVIDGLTYKKLNFITVYEHATGTSIDYEIQVWKYEVQTVALGTAVNLRLICHHNPGVLENSSLAFTKTLANDFEDTPSGYLSKYVIFLKTNAGSSFIYPSIDWNFKL